MQYLIGSKNSEAVFLAFTCIALSFRTTSISVYNNITCTPRILLHRMLFRIAEQLRHAPQSQTLVGLFSFRRAAFSFCSATLLAPTHTTDEISTPQPLQKSHDPDEAQLKAEKRKKRAEY